MKHRITVRSWAWFLSAALLTAAGCGGSSEGGGGGTAGTGGAGGGSGTGGIGGGGGGGSGGGPDTRAWGTPELIQTDAGGPGDVPHLAMNTSGGAVVVWEQSGEPRTIAWANHFSPNDGWSIARRIDGLAQVDARSPTVAIDPAGNAVAVWQQSDGVQNSIWSNRNLPDNGWLAIAKLIETDNAGMASAAHVALDALGNGLAVWTQSDGMRNNIWANRYNANDGWSVAQRIDGNNPNNGSGARLAMNADGDALVVWGQYDGNRAHIWANEYTPAEGWGVAGPIEDNIAGPANGSYAAVDSNGNGIALWIQDDDGGPKVIWSSRYTVDGGWGAPERIDGDEPGNAEVMAIPHVAFDSSGNALALWAQVDGLRSPIWWNRYTPGEGWGTAERIVTDNSSTTGALGLAVNASGRALALWPQLGDGGFDVMWSSRYSPAGGWTAAERVSPDARQAETRPQVGIDSNGNGLAVWRRRRTGINDNIWANRLE